MAITTKIINSKRILRGLLIFLALLMIVGSAVLTTKALRDAYQLASDAGLKQAAEVYSNIYQVMQAAKIKPENAEKTIDEIFQDFVYKFRALNKGSSILGPVLGYQVYIFNDEGIVVSSINSGPVKDELESAPATNKLKNKLEQLVKGNIGNLSNFLRDPNATKLVESAFETGESPDGFFNKLLNPNSRYVLAPIFRINDGSPTNQGIIITRSNQLLITQGTIIKEKLQENLAYLVGYSLIALLLFILLLKALNRLINQKAIAEGWRQFSHDVDTPITNIKRHAEKILAADKGGRSIKVIFNAVDNIEEALNQQRILTRGDEYLASVEPINIKSLIVEATQNVAMKERFRRQGVSTIKPSYDNQNTTILANKTSLLRAIVNLIKNAIDFSPQDGKIDVFVTEQGDFVVITIQDMGVGISEEVKDAFGSEASSPRADGEVGQGLGLTIVEKVMKAHNGELIWPKNRADRQGAEVSLKLPIYRAP